MFLLKMKLTKLDCLFVVFLISLSLSVVQVHGFPQFGSREELDSPGLIFHASPNSFKDSFRELLEVETADVISTILPAPTLSSSDDDYSQYSQSTTFELENPIQDAHENEHHESTPVVLEDEASEPTPTVPEEKESFENQHHPQEEIHESEKKEQEDEAAAVTEIQETPTPRIQNEEETPLVKSEDESKSETDSQTNNNNSQESKKEREREEELYTNHNLHASVEVEQKEDSESEKTEETKISELRSAVDCDDDEHKKSEIKNNGTVVQSEETDQLQEPESTDVPQILSDSREHPTVGTIDIREININNNSKELQSQESSNNDDSTPQLGDTLINDNNNSSTSNADAELVTLDKFIKHGATYYFQNVNDDACLTAHKHKFLDTGKGLILGKITAEECEREDRQIFDAIVMREDDEESQTPNSEEYWLSSLKHSINEVSMVMTSNESAFFSNPLKNSIQIVPIESDSSTFLIKSNILGKCIENQGKHKEILYTACDSSSLSQQWKANFLYEDTKAKL